MQIMTTEKLIEYCKTYPWKRQIKQLHVHHTWKPNHADYTGSNGLQLQEAMKAYHMNQLGWRDIGQHLTLLPDGQWVTGRDFNDDPASISGWNSGSFAIEMVGNFDKGHDTFGGKQADAMFAFLSFLVGLKHLDIATQVKFHRDSPTAHKTCPGTGIDRMWFMNRLKGEIKVDFNESLEFLKQKAGIDPAYWKNRKNIDKYFEALITKVANAWKGDK